MFKLDYSIMEDIVRFGEIEAFKKPLECITNIKSLQLLLEASNDYYPEDYKETYKRTINNLIKGYTKLLEEEMVRLNNYFKYSENYKEE